MYFLYANYCVEMRAASILEYLLKLYLNEKNNAQKISYTIN